MRAISPAHLASVLERLHGIQLEGVATISGGQAFVGVRPIDLEPSRGFQILLSQSPRKVYGSFLADHYAGRLIRDMSQAGTLQRDLFESLARMNIERGIRLVIEIDGTPIADPTNLPPGLWKSFELEVQRRTPPWRVTEDQVRDLAIDTASLTLDLALCLMELEADADEGVDLVEGAKVVSLATRYERNAMARAICIAHHGRACSVCGFDFESVYGPLGGNFIEVHHLVSLSSRGGEYKIDPIKDLIPVCSNCHKMLHQKTPPLPVEELRRFIAETRPMYDVLGEPG